MSPIFLIIDFIALGYAFILLMVVSHRYKISFLLGCLLPIPIVMLVSLLLRGDGLLSFTEILMFLLRGGLVASILSGTLVNFLLSHISKKLKNRKIEDKSDGIHG